MLPEKVTDLAMTEWSSPIVVALKKNGFDRSCVDYQKLSTVTVHGRYSIRGMDECIDSLNEANRIWVLHANAGYWKIKTDEHAKDETAFVTHHGLFRYKRVPFGLKKDSVTY